MTPATISMQTAKRRLWRFIALSMAALAFSTALAGGVHADPRLDAGKKVIAALIADANALARSDPDAATATAAINTIIDRYFDYDRIARFAAGNAWREANDDRKQRYKKAFRTVLISQAQTYLDGIAGVEYVEGEATLKGDRFIIVGGSVHDPSGQVPDANLNWRLYAKPGETPRIMDIEVENISMLLTQQQEFTAVINSNGGDFDALIMQLEKTSAGIDKK